MNKIRKIKSATRRRVGFSPLEKTTPAPVKTRGKGTTPPTESGASTQMKPRTRGGRSKAALGRRKEKRKEKQRAKSELAKSKDYKAKGKSTRGSKPNKGMAVSNINIGARPAKPTSLSNLIGFRVGFASSEQCSLTAGCYAAAFQRALQKCGRLSVLGLGVHPSWGVCSVKFPLLGIGWATGEEQGMLLDCNCPDAICPCVVGDIAVVVGPGWVGKLGAVAHAARVFVLDVNPEQDGVEVTKLKANKEALLTIAGESSVAIRKPLAIMSPKSLGKASTMGVPQYSRLDLGVMAVVGVSFGTGKLPGRMRDALSLLHPAPTLDEGTAYNISGKTLSADIPDTVENVLVGRADNDTNRSLQERMAVNEVREADVPPGHAAELVRAAIEYARRRAIFRRLSWSPYNLVTNLLGWAVDGGVSGVLINLLIYYAYLKIFWSWMGFPRATVRDFWHFGIKQQWVTIARVLKWLLFGMNPAASGLGFFWGSDPEITELGSIWQLIVGGRAALLLDVVFEEVFKRYFGAFGTAAIVCVEAACHCSFDYLPVATMHVAASQLPLTGGVLLHYLWNHRAVNSGGPKGKLSDTILSVRFVPGSSDLPGVCTKDSGLDLAFPAKRARLLKWPSERPDCLSRSMLWRIGPTVDISMPLCFYSCPHNDVAAVSRRICNGTARWDSDLRGHMRVWRMVRSSNLLPEIITYDVPQVSFDGWAADYPEAFRKRLSVWKESFEQEGLTSSDFKIEAFVKIERLPLTLFSSDDKDRKPRLIQGRRGKLKVATGPWFKWAGKVLARNWNGRSQLYYPSGASAEEIGQWSSRAEADGLIPHCFDFSQWDSTVGPGASLAWLDACRGMGCPGVIEDLALSRLRQVVGRTKFRAKYTKLAQVSSGDGDTSVGNSYIQGLGWLWVLHQVVPGVAANCRVMVLGDDSVIAAPKQLTIASISACWDRLGFKLTGGSTEWDTAQFCSGRFWRSEGTRVFGPSPGRVIGKTFWSVINWGDSKRVPWLRGVCLGLSLNCSHVPILGALVQRLLELAGKGKIIEDQRNSRRVRIEATKPNPLVDASFEQLSLISNLSIRDLRRMQTSAASISSIDHVFEGANWEELLLAAP